MKLAAFLKENRIKQSEFARQIDVSASAVTRWIKGDRRPNWPTMDEIEKITGGQVGPSDFIGNGESK